jgi:hypothetical protein
MYFSDGVFGVIAGVLRVLQCVIGVRWMCVGGQCGVREDEIVQSVRRKEAGLAERATRERSWQARVTTEATTMPDDVRSALSRSGSGRRLQQHIYYRYVL